MSQCDGWPDEWDVVAADQGTNRFRIDVNGQWYYDGMHIQRRGMVRLFAEQVTREADGGWVLHWGPRAYPVTVADTPAVIHGIGPLAASSGRFVADLVDGRHMELHAGSVRIGPANVPYAALPDGTPVRFSRNAYYQLADWIVEENGTFAIAAGNRRWPIVDRDDS